MNKSKSSLDLDLSGGINYRVELNGSIILTSESELSLTLKTGINQLKVTTDKNCQGIFNETINNSTDIMVYPNPISNENNIQIVVGDASLKSIDLTLTSVYGKVMFSKTVNLNYGKATLDVSNLTSGLYILTVPSEEGQTNLKIIKK